MYEIRKKVDQYHIFKCYKYKSLHRIVLDFTGSFSVTWFPQNDSQEWNLSEIILVISVLKYLQEKKSHMEGIRSSFWFKTQNQISIKIFFFLQNYFFLTVYHLFTGFLKWLSLLWQYSSSCTYHNRARTFHFDIIM